MKASEWYFEVVERNNETYAAFVTKAFWDQNKILSNQSVSDEIENLLPPNLSIDVLDEMEPGLFLSYVDEHDTRETLKLTGFIELKGLIK